MGAQVTPCQYVLDVSTQNALVNKKIKLYFKFNKNEEKYFLIKIFYIQRECFTLCFFESIYFPLFLKSFMKSSQLYTILVD